MENPLYLSFDGAAPIAADAIDFMANVRTHLPVPVRMPEPVMAADIGREEFARFLEEWSGKSARKR